MKLSDGERDILAELNADARELAHLEDDHPTEDEINAVCDRFEELYGEWLSTRVDPDEPYSDREPY